MSRNTQDSAVDLLCAEPERLEPGLVVVDKRLRLGEDVVIDVLARDSLGYPVIALFSGGDVAQDLGRMARAVAGLQGGRYLLARLYGEQGLDPGQRPRFVLLASRFPDSSPQLLDMMAQVEVHAVEYRVVRSSVGRPVLDLQTFHRTAGPGPAAPSWSGRSSSSSDRGSRASSPAPRPTTRARAPAPEPPPPAELAPAAAPTPAPTPEPAAAPQPAAAPKTEPTTESAAPSDGGTDLFSRAVHDIGYLSQRVRTEKRSDDRVEFLVEDKLLAVVERGSEGPLVSVGAAKPASGPIQDDEAYHDELSRVFVHFFDQFGEDESAGG